MSSHKAMTASQVRSLIESEEIEYIKIGVFDMDGILRGKYMHRDKFLSAMDKGFGFCDVVLGWDSYDQLYDSSTYTGWHTAYPDAPVRVLPETCRRIPFEENTLLLLGEFEGKAETICPRGVLRRVLDRADGMGYSVLSSFEFEFFLFDESPHSVREKGYRDMKPITPGFFGYSILRNSVHAEFYHELLDACQTMGFPLEGLHTETGPGVLEAALQHTEGVESADRAALFKTFTKVLAQRRGWMATFMAKWSQDWPGQSGHIHISLKDKSGGTPFYDADKPDSVSDTMRWFIGGQQALMPELLSMVACTVNSYSRLIPGFWAPTHATWGVDNRTCALRVISGSAAAQRVEYRIAAADINPYISLAAALGSGLWGIENKIEPTDPVKGNAYEKKFPKALDLPSTLFDAAQKLRKSKAAQELFGDAFVEHYAQSREWEEREFRKSITHWELERYFEII
ncbi:MAG: glutamine synthetase [Candidatus Hydrogenedentes bacterium]|nr:glutamine synthetase [Candidatus Hydrogenedentota bacterium]